jgi:LysM repeat protein
MSEAAITVAAMPSALPRLHRALRGETMASVASRYGLPANVLAMHNNVPARSALKAGQDLKLPQTLAVSLRGQKVEGDVDSMMVAGVGVTPFRFLFEKQGGQLKWDAKNARVTAQNGAHQVTLAIGSRSALVNKKEVMMDLAAFLVSGRTMVPLRFFEKALNASVEWEPATGRLLVAMAQ